MGYLMGIFDGDIVILLRILMGIFDGGYCNIIEDI